jgi:predicted aminopeptidase
MTETIANVLPQLKELQIAWRKQDFQLTKEQQQQYDLLIATRRERVRQLYAEERACKSSFKEKEIEF